MPECWSDLVVPAGALGSFQSFLNNSRNGAFSEKHANFSKRCFFRKYAWSFETLYYNLQQQAKRLLFLPLLSCGNIEEENCNSFVDVGIGEQFQMHPYCPPPASDGHRRQRRREPMAQPQPVMLLLQRCCRAGRSPLLTWLLNARGREAPKEKGCTGR